MIVGSTVRYVNFIFIVIFFVTVSCSSYFSSSSQIKMKQNTFVNVSIDKALATYGLSTGGVAREHMVERV